MKVMLEFLDGHDIRVHQRDLEYQGMPPLPAVGEVAFILDRDRSGASMAPIVRRVVRRQFTYLYGDSPDFPDIKVTFWVEAVDASA